MSMSKRCFKHYLMRAVDVAFFRIKEIKGEMKMTNMIKYDSHALLIFNA